MLETGAPSSFPPRPYAHHCFGALVHASGDNYPLFQGNEDMQRSIIKMSYYKMFYLHLCSGDICFPNKHTG